MPGRWEAARAALKWSKMTQSQGSFGRVVRGVIKKCIHQPTQHTRIVKLVVTRPTRPIKRHCLQKLLVRQYDHENSQGRFVNPFLLAVGTGAFSVVQDGDSKTAGCMPSVLPAAQSTKKAPAKANSSKNTKPAKVKRGWVKKELDFSNPAD